MLAQRIKNDVKEAMKSGDAFKRDTLRFLQAAIKQIVIDEKKEATDELIMGVINSQIKKRLDSIAQYKQASRTDLVEKEEKELAIVSQYLPKQLSDDELRTKIIEIIAQVGASSIKDLGKIIGVAKTSLLGKATNARIAQQARELLC